jgi:hypothetical protein
VSFDDLEVTVDTLAAVCDIRPHLVVVIERALRVLRVEDELVFPPHNSLYCGLFLRRPKQPEVAKPSDGGCWNAWNFVLVDSRRLYCRVDRF